MNKLKETVSTVWRAARYSFSFCLRNNKRDTLIVASLLLIQTLIGYGMILLMGNLISSIQVYLTTAKPHSLSLSGFMNGKFYIPCMVFIVALFLEIILQKYKSFIVSRQRHILRVANTQEINTLKGSLDIARRKSKSFDDITQKIDELPEGWYTRIAFAGELIEFAGSLIGFIIFGVSLAISNPWYVVILVVSSVPMIFAEFTAVNRFWKQSLELVPHHKKRSVLQQAFFGDTSFLQGLMFNQMPVLSAQIKENHGFVTRTLDQLRWRNMKITLGAYIIAMAGLSIVLMHSVYSTLYTVGDIGVLTVIIASSRRLQSSIREIVFQIATQWQSVKGIIMIEEEYFSMKPLLETKDEVAPGFAGTPAISFSNVSFRYPERDVPVLKNISFTIEPNSRVVIVGKNGSGKSSLIGLLLRHYDPTEGNICVDTIDLRRIAPKNWNAYVCALLQNFTVLERQVGEEIASSRLDQPIDMDAVKAASTFAGFDTVIENDPKGYASQIGTEFGGREFSGGEEQRLALSRAKYRNTPILILDEPDAKLDPEAAKRLMENVFALRGMTVIIVTQHISRATQGDKVIVLDKGEIAEMGTHAELVSKNGKYASMLSKDKERLGN